MLYELIRNNEIESELEPVRFFQIRSDWPVQTLELTGKKPVKNRPVTILNFIGVKSVHLMHLLHNQYFREIVFYLRIHPIPRF